MIWEFLSSDGTPANLAGSEFELVVAWPAVPFSSPGGARPEGEIVHSSDVVDARPRRCGP